MRWTTPRTWAAAETETAAIFNQAVRDKQNLLKTCQDNQGIPKLAYKCWAYSGVQRAGVNANAAGGVDTELTAFTTILPANFFTTHGEVLLFTGTLVFTNNANTKTVKVELGGVKATLWSRATNVTPNCICPFECVIAPRLFSGASSPQVSVNGQAWIDAAAAGAPMPLVINTSISSMTQAFTAPITFKFFLASSAAADVFLTDATLICGTSAVAGGTP